ncbi:MAG: NAD(P)(+) transhydrogenase (Re/Si-specific) subunit alpha, partial [Gemmatimonadota bacterium]
MLVVVPGETTPGETRVAMTPDAARRIVDDDLSLRVEAGAGEDAGIEDADYRDVGVEVAGGDALYDGADAVLRVRPPRPLEDGHEADRLPEGSVLIGLLDPHGSADLFRRLAGRNVTAFSLELLPRITRAQRMDALSSMSTVAGYKAALIAAGSLDKFFPMLMTAAGTVTPADVFVLGAGVAGLQAIATCRRLGAEVEAFDIRPEVAEQVE